RVFDLVAPRRSNQEGDLPQTSVQEGQVAGADASHGGGSSSNLAGVVAPPQSVPSVDLGGVLSQIREMMLESRQVMVENGQQVNLRLASFDERYESHNARMDRLTQARTRSLDGVNTTSNFNGSASIPTANGLNGQPHVENFPPHVARQLPTHHENRGDIPSGHSCGGTS
ncbi:hypothetical protein LINGRAHAP2_LOCUS4117, partial [Linum grandiflorum]